MTDEPLDFFSAAHKAQRDSTSLQSLAQQLLDQLTLDERLSLLDGDLGFWPGLHSMISDYNKTAVSMGALPRLKIPGIQFTDGPRGIVMGKSTAFPTSIARGATWDPALEYRIGQAIGLEGRAQGANFFGGVCINLPRHPAWGRTQETYSEDPVLLGSLGTALARGAGENLMPCVKHFALNSMEDARFTVDVKVDESTLHEVYLPHFKQVVDEGGPAVAVMSSYNKLNGEYCGQNKTLLTGILRDQWKFSGLVMTDFILGLRDAVLSVQAGCDIEAPMAWHRHAALGRGLRNQELSLSDVDASALRILASQLEHYARRQRSEPAPEVIFCQEHQALAREAARRSIVLLKNDPPAKSDRPLLPLDPASLKSVAVIGRLADLPNLGDHGSSNVRSPATVSPFKGIRDALSSNAKVTLTTSDVLSEAVRAAKQADIAILIVGNTADDEGENIKNFPKIKPPLPSISELFKYAIPLGLRMLRGGITNSTDDGHKQGSGGDRATVRLRQIDIDLINAVGKANPRTIVSIITAGAVIVEPWLAEIPALLYSWYNGCQGGHAFADVLFGHNPAGRLPYSIAKTEADLPFFDAAAKHIVYDRWFGQRLIDRKGAVASFPLGWGLSYTIFSLADASVVRQTEESFTIKVTVSNTGSVEGRHVVQIYGRPDPKPDDFPHRVLLGFLSVAVGGGASATITVTAATQPLKRWNIKQNTFVWRSRRTAIEVSSHSGDPGAIKLVHDL